MLCAPKPFSFYDRNNPNPRDPWMLFNLEPLRWMFKDGKATLKRGGIRMEAVAETVEVNMKYGSFNKVHYELEEQYVKLYLNDELIQTVELPYYPSMCSVATKSNEEVLVKIVNFAECETDVEIQLDVPVQSEYSVEYLTGQADAENTLEVPTNVCDRVANMSGAAEKFTFKANPLSVNVLHLRMQ